MANILIIDDEISISQLFQIALQKNHHTVDTANSGDEAIKKIKQHFYDVIVTDLSMPSMTGMELLPKIKELSPETATIMMTAYGSTKTAVDAIKLGAYDYLTKPLQLDDLQKTIQNALNHTQLQRENVALRKVAVKSNLHQPEGVSEAFRKVMDWVDQVSRATSSVLILGESGTGKELIARQIHMRSDRSKQPFVAVNCAAIPEHLIESELFGSVKGAFTGADQHRMGFFEASHKGTIFLDEIGELPLQLQSKLLRVLAEKKVVRVGSTQEIPVDIRVVSATNQVLSELVAKGQFREDLYYRLNVLQIDLPPLRERREDIPVLAKYFLKKFCDEYRKKISGFDDAALEKMCAYTFPGNIRELINIIEQCVVLEAAPVIRVETMPEKIRNTEKPKKAVGENTSEINLEQQVDQYEKQLILDALAKANGIKTQAAKLLNISFRSLRYRLQKLGMDDSED